MFLVNKNIGTGSGRRLCGLSEPVLTFRGDEYAVVKIVYSNT